MLFNSKNAASLMFSSTVFQLANGKVVLRNISSSSVTLSPDDDFSVRLAVYFKQSISCLELDILKTMQ